MRTEAEPCLLGRSESTYSNERRRGPAGRPRLHPLVALAPGMVWLGLSCHYGASCRSARRWSFLWYLGQLGVVDALPAVVHLQAPVFPLAHQGFAFRWSVAS